MDRMLGARVLTVFSNYENLESNILDADLLVSGVLIPGAAAPKLVTRGHVTAMKPGSAIVDVAIDQGGGETSRPTAHADPIYILDDVVHYCVANMPGAVSPTSAYALKADPNLRNGLHVCRGKISQREVAEALGYDYVEPERCLKY